MPNQSKKQPAFTLTELLIVVIILGIIAAFAIPQYNRTISRGHIRSAITNLMSIHGANTIRRAELGSYWPAVAGSYDLDAINANLRLGIIADSAVDYNCAGDGITFSCTATDINGHFTVSINNASSTPTCIGGHCP